MTAQPIEQRDRPTTVLPPGRPALVVAGDPLLARMDRAAAAQQRRSAARARDLTALLRERPELAGVHAPADFAVDALRWCV